MRGAAEPVRAEPVEEPNVRTVAVRLLEATELLQCIADKINDTEVKRLLKDFNDRSEFTAKLAIINDRFEEEIWHHGRT